MHDERDFARAKHVMVRKSGLVGCWPVSWHDFSHDELSEVYFPCCSVFAVGPQPRRIFHCHDLSLPYMSTVLLDLLWLVSITCCSKAEKRNFITSTDRDGANIAKSCRPVKYTGHAPNVRK